MAYYDSKIDFSRPAIAGSHLDDYLTICGWCKAHSLLSNAGHFSSMITIFCKGQAMNCIYKICILFCNGILTVKSLSEREYSLYEIYISWWQINTLSGAT